MALERGGEGQGLALKKNTSGSSLRMLPLCLAVSVVGLGQSMLFVMLPILTEETGIGLGGFSLVMTGGILAFFLAAPFWGRLGDRRDRRQVMLTGCVFVLLGHGGFVLAVEAAAAGVIGPDAGLLALLFARVVYGAAAAALFPMAQAWVGDVATEAVRLRGLAGLSAAMSAGRLLGPPLAAGLTILAPLMPLYALLASALFSALALLFLRPAPPRAGPPEEVPAGKDSGRIVAVIAAGLLLTTMLGQLQFTLGVQVQARLGLDATASSQFVGVLLTAATLAAFVIQVTLIRRSRSLPPLLLAVVCGLAATGVGAIAWGEGRIHFLVGAVAVGAAVAVAFPFCAALVTALAGPQRRGRFLGFFASAQTLGYACGALLGGLYAWAPAASFGLAAAAPLLAFGLIQIGMRGRRLAQKGRAQEGGA